MTGSIIKNIIAGNIKAPNPGIMAESLSIKNVQYVSLKFFTVVA
jgi:hypothetical protein